MVPRGGRPRGPESAERVQALLRLLAAGHDPREAARLAKVKPERAWALLAERQFRAAVVALLDAREERAA